LDEPKPHTVSRALELFQDDPALCARLGAAGRMRMEREFAPEVAAGRIDEALEEVIG
jgi:glycosyltransferase involved in cell wall biosynthesis